MPANAFRAVETTGHRRVKLVELKPNWPSAGVQAAYQAKLNKLIEEMDDSVQYWVKVRYKNSKPATLAMDDVLPANELKRTIDELVKRWQKAWNDAAPELAKYFSLSVLDRNDANLRQILREANWTVRFKMTTGMRDVLKATIDENVSLIKSIPQQYFKAVRGDVMRSIQAGRDMGQLSKALQKNYGVTKRRAALIARTQNNLATGAMDRARKLELGLTKSKWRHSHAGKEPRPTHLANDGKLYDHAKGWFDPDPKVRRHIYPGELINCRCSSITVVPGFS